MHSLAKKLQTSKSFPRPILQRLTETHLKLLNLKNGSVRGDQGDDLFSGAVDRQDGGVLVRPDNEKHNCWNGENSTKNCNST